MLYVVLVKKIMIIKKTILIIGCINIFFISNASEITYDLNRYNFIIDRAPFGSESLDIDVVSSVQSDQKAVAAAKSAEKLLRLCFIFETNKGDIRAGFENKTAKQGDPKSIVLGVGDSFQGMRLLSINLNDSSATLDRNGVKIKFSLSKPPASIKMSQSPEKTQTERRFGGGFKQIDNSSLKSSKPELSKEEQEIQREQITENLRLYQMDVIRSGQPPLPIPLTQEMDDQLVAEGILPPK